MWHQTERGREEECPKCGGDVDSSALGQNCDVCGWGTVSVPDTPEGGWPRNSQMDRL